MTTLDGLPDRDRTVHPLRRRRGAPLYETSAVCGEFLDAVITSPRAAQWNAGVDR
jgi:hypothetical protein